MCICISRKGAGWLSCRIYLVFWTARLRSWDAFDRSDPLAWELGNKINDIDQGKGGE